MHILFLSDNFPPEVNAPASRTFDHCAQWVAAGHRVTVITCAPNFPQGKVYAGYRNALWQEEWIEGIRVIRVWSYVSRNEGFLKRTLDYLSFMVSSFVASLFIRGVDVIVGTSPQFFTACSACLAGVFKRRPWVFEVRDLWPDSIRAVGAMDSEAIFDTLERLELFLYRKAAAIVVVTRSFKENLISRGVPGEKIHIVTNGANLSAFAQREKDLELLKELDLAGRFVVGYIGTHGMAHGLDTVIDAAARASRDPRMESVHFLLLGDGAERARLLERVAQEALTNVTMLQSVPKSDVARYWSILDGALIHLRKSPVFEGVIPSKLFECMAMGIPVLHGVSGESARIVEDEQVGILFEPENADALLEAIARLRQSDDGQAEIRGKAVAAARKFDRVPLAGAMERLLTQVGAR